MASQTWEHFFGTPCINIFFSTNAVLAAAASPGPQTWSWLRSQSAPAATTAPTTATAARPGEKQQQH